MKNEKRIQVQKISDPKQLEAAFEIREKVFVQEQSVDPSEEYDEFEDSSTHFLASVDESPAGTARWRFTEKGCKLERFAVLQANRGAGVGAALVEAVLKDISENPQAKHKKCYLHAQVDAMPLYAKFGFKQVGNIFEECKILHYKMELYL